MKALYWNGKKAEVRDVPAPTPAAGEALVRVEVAGVCRTDVEIAKGYMGFEGVMGHEFCGVVEECPKGDWKGKRVVGEINLPCRTCSYCKAGLERHCPYRTVLGIAGKSGAFAEYLTIPVENLHAVPENIGPETAVFTEPVAACFEILEQTDVEGKSVAVLGDGKLGILAARVLSNAGPRSLVLVGKHRRKLELVKPDKIDAKLIVEFLSEAREPEKKLDIVVEATGRPEGFRAALNSVRPRGVIVQKTTVAGKVEIDLSRVVVDEVTVIGSRCGPFPPAIEALSSGSVRVDDLVTSAFPLERADEALREASQRGILKVLVDMR